MRPGGQRPRHAPVDREGHFVTRSVTEEAARHGPAAPPPSRDRLDSALLAWAVVVVLSFLAMALSFWSLTAAFSGPESLAPIRRLVIRQALGSPAVRHDFVLFAGGLVSLHLLAALLVWLLVQCIRYAHGGAGPRRVPCAVLVSGVLAAWIAVANSVWFPRSATAFDLDWADREILGTASAFDLVTGALCGAALVTVFVALRRAWHRAWIRRSVLYLGLCATGFVAYYAMTLDGEVRGAGSRPNVILLGIDSLRPDMVGVGRSAGYTPRLDEFLAQARRAIDATTPLARTFPSWVTVLTGRHPVSTGVRENLMDPSVVRLGRTLPQTLRDAGWSTVYATDEVRFSVIDRRFGFDQVEAPPAGAQDYLFSTLGDLPLSNLVANTWLGAWLLPWTYANRGAAATYRPYSFIDRLSRRLDFNRPTLLCVHLTLPHWPYYWSDSGRSFWGDASGQPYPYLEAVEAVDRQFGELMRVLDRKGALSNALVIVLSDHGEALGRPGDNIIRGVRPGDQPLAVNTFGHGNSVLSPSQYSILLAARGYGGVKLAGDNGGVVTEPLSLEDVAPTVLDLLGLPAQPTEGVSFASALLGQAGEAATATRLRFTETGLAVGFRAGGRLDEGALVELAGSYFGVDPPTGSVWFRRDAVPELLATRERAVFTENLLLAAVPGVDGMRYLLVPRAGGTPRQLRHRPDPAQDGTATVLWDALFARYGRELSPPAATSP